MKKILILLGLILSVNLSMLAIEEIRKQNIENDINNLKAYFDNVKNVNMKNFKTKWDKLTQDLHDITEEVDSDVLKNRVPSLKGLIMPIIDRLNQSYEKYQNKNNKNLNIFDFIDLDKLKDEINKAEKSINDIKVEINGKTIWNGDKRTARNLVNKFIDNDLKYIISQLKPVINETPQKRIDSFVKNFIDPIKNTITDEEYENESTVYKVIIYGKLLELWNKTVDTLKLYALENPDTLGKIKELNDLGKDLIEELKKRIEGYKDWESLSKYLKEDFKVKLENFAKQMPENIGQDYQKLNLSQQNAQAQNVKIKFETKKIAEDFIYGLIRTTVLTLDFVKNQLLHNELINKFSKKPKPDRTDKERENLEHYLNGYIQDIESFKISSPDNFNRIKEGKRLAFVELFKEFNKETDQKKLKLDTLEEINEKILKTANKALNDYKAGSKTSANFIILSKDINNLNEQIKDTVLPAILAVSGQPKNPLENMEQYIYRWVTNLYNSLQKLAEKIQKTTVKK